MYSTCDRTYNTTILPISCAFHNAEAETFPLDYFAFRSIAFQIIALLLVDLAEVQKLRLNHMTIVFIAERSDGSLFIMLSYINVTFAIFFAN